MPTATKMFMIIALNYKLSTSVPVALNLLNS